MHALIGKFRVIMIIVFAQRVFPWDKGSRGYLDFEINAVSKREKQL